RSAPGTLHALARTGFVLLCASGADLAAARRAAEAVTAPVRVLDAGTLPDSGAALAAAGLAAPGEGRLVRPDAHAAAVPRPPGRALLLPRPRRRTAPPPSTDGAGPPGRRRDRRLGARRGCRGRRPATAVAPSVHRAGAEPVPRGRAGGLAGGAGADHRVAH